MEMNRAVANMASHLADSMVEKENEWFMNNLYFKCCECMKMVKVCDGVKIVHERTDLFEVHKIPTRAFEILCKACLSEEESK